MLSFQTHQGRAGGQAAEAQGRVGIPAAGGEGEPGEEAAACLGGNEAGSGGSPAEGDERAGAREGAVPERAQGEVGQGEEEGEIFIDPFLLTWLPWQCTVSGLTHTAVLWWQLTKNTKGRCQLGCWRHGEVGRRTPPLVTTLVIN